MKRQFTVLTSGAIIFVLHLNEDQAPANKTRQKAGVINGINIESPTLRVTNCLVDDTKRNAGIDEIIKKLKAPNGYNFSENKHHPGYVTARRYRMIADEILKLKAPEPEKKKGEEKTA